MSDELGRSALGSSLPAHDLPHFYLGDMRDFFVRNNLAVLSGFAPAAANASRPPEAVPFFACVRVS